MTRHSENTYGYYGAYGAPTYDFKPMGNERAGEYSGVKYRAERRPRKRGNSSPAVFTGICLCVLLLGFGIYARNEMVSISEECFALSTEIEALCDEQIMLKIRHETYFADSETERIAIEELGMVSLLPSNLYPYTRDKINKKCHVPY